MAALCLLGSLAAAQAGSVVDGLTGTAFSFTAKPGYISTADGNSVYIWGYANTNGTAQYPGPTLKVKQGDTVSITLTNELPVPVSLYFPGQNGAPTVTGPSSPGLLTAEVPVGASGGVTYSFQAKEAGTYVYYSGTQPDLQLEMGLVGTLVVYPTNNSGAIIPNQAYSDPGTAFAHEFLFFLSEMDETLHITAEQKVQANQPVVIDTTKRRPVYWFINGRTAPDTMLDPWPQSSWLPSQPYSSMPVFHPGEDVLMRVVGGGRDAHPFHHHGNHARTVARDGRLLASSPTSGPDLQQYHFTVPSTPGGTIDAIFNWTGAGMGWDIYGHSPSDPLEPYEDASSHGLPFPVILPPDQSLSFGQMYGGSPFMGSPADLPRGQVGFNAGNGFMYMWHSHNEKEIVNNNLFPGGLLTMALIVPWH